MNFVKFMFFGQYLVSSPPSPPSTEGDQYLFTRRSVSYLSWEMRIYSDFENMNWPAKQNHHNTTIVY
jgi:hypothetical protein